MDRAPGFSQVAFGPRKRAGNYLCFTPRPALPDFLPTYWLSNTDQSDPGAEIYCRAVDAPYKAAVRKALELIAGGL